MQATEVLVNADLLRTCTGHVGRQLDAREKDRLCNWWEAERGRGDGLATTLLAQSEPEWAQTVMAHRSHRHAWYDHLAEEVSIDEYAGFFLENWAFPSFLALVERALDAQICDDGRDAVLENMRDEQEPVPHATLMRRLIEAVKGKAGDGVSVESYASLIDRTLVLYYGYYCDPWHLVGSLYVTELMAHHRMAKMGAGLERLGFSPFDLEYIHVHLMCDDDHARDWNDRVITPTVRLSPSVRPSIVAGMAACLESSARYLDDLVRRRSSDGLASAS